MDRASPKEGRSNSGIKRAALSLQSRQTDAGVIIAVKVVPGSSRTRIAGIYGGSLKVNIAAAPEKGKANKELTTFLAKLLGLSKSAVSVAAGEHNPHKEVLVAGLTSGDLLGRLGPYLT